MGPHAPDAGRPAGTQAAIPDMVLPGATGVRTSLLRMRRPTHHAGGGHYW
ncbi:hypothetical protein [Micromonospora zhanjiangensis]|uniref:Uncharacterized protein n=1 Tax=Micromonospora zhanjiangensis TaxID=1522057 RepID=A0ABV8KXX8_9ACTN